MPIKYNNTRPRFERKAKSKADVLKEILEWKGDDDLEAGQIGMAGVGMFELARVTPKPAPNVPSTQAPEPAKNYGVDI
jgi:hypothetical protein